MDMFDQEQNTEAVIALLESKLNRALTDEEMEKVAFVAGISDENMVNNLFQQLGNQR